MKPFIVYSLILISFFSCRRDDEQYAVGNSKGVCPSSLFYFSTVQPSVLEADSISICQFQIQLDPQADSTLRFISLSTNLGELSNGRMTDTLKINDQGIATGFLLSSKLGVAKLTARVGNLTIDTLIRWLAALPDDILVSSNSYSGDSTSSFQISAILFRNPGRGLPSDPDKVFFQIHPATSLNLQVPEFNFSSNHQVNVIVSNRLPSERKFFN
jgi:hypothetical protein